MKTLRITSSGQFMTNLLSKELFDIFTLEKAKITTAYTYEIDGRIHPEFFPSEERDDITEEFTSWSTVKPFIYEAIKGKNTPLLMQIVLHAPSEMLTDILQKAGNVLTRTDLASLLVTIRYDKGQLTCTSACSLNIFTMDKTVEKEWDNELCRYLTRCGIEYDDILN